MASKKTVYFAHSMRVYGTPEAEQARQQIHALRQGWDLFDPEDFTWKAAEADSSPEEVFQAVIAVSDEVIVLEYEGHVGRGAYQEVLLALASELPVYALRAGQLIQVRAVELVDTQDWRIRYGRLLCDYVAVHAKRRAAQKLVAAHRTDKENN